MFDWMMPIYKLIGANHPTLSLVGAFLLGGSLFAGWWWITGKEYRERNPPVKQSAKTTAFQDADSETRLLLSLGAVA